MSASMYFYDLETSGISAKNCRIMQFAGQRVDLDLKKIGEPDNYLIKMTTDVLPEPEAILITGITPQQTFDSGISEAEFLTYFHKSIALPDTIFIGFNSIHFDDEFVRFLNYRNFYDAYEWQWQDGRSRWDMLDVARMTRALRPEGIKWPFASDGKPSNKLELIASVNNLMHEKAHDALSDVNATIALAKLIRQKQPKLYEYLFKIRDKRTVEKIVSQTEPFVYTSGQYGSQFESTTIALTVASHPTQKGSVFVYDLRYDPSPYADKKPSELAELLAKYHPQDDEEFLPVKQLQFNRCPAVAPLSVLDESSSSRLSLDMKKIEQNAKALISMSKFSDNLAEAIKINEKQKQTSFVTDVQDVDSQLYDGFFNESDKNKMKSVRMADENKLADLHPDFNDGRLDKLLLLYKARQFPKCLSQDEQKIWEDYRIMKLTNGGDQSQLAKYFSKINELSTRTDLNEPQIYLLEELKLYGESLAPYSSD